MKNKLLLGLAALTTLTSCYENIDGYRVYETKNQYIIEKDEGLYFENQFVDVHKDGTLDHAYTKAITDKGTIHLPSELTKKDHEMYDTLYLKIKESK